MRLIHGPNFSFDGIGSLSHESAIAVIVWQSGHCAWGEKKAGNHNAERDISIESCSISWQKNLTPLWMRLAKAIESAKSPILSYFYTMKEGRF